MNCMLNTLVFCCIIFRLKFLKKRKQRKQKWTAGIIATSHGILVTNPVLHDIILAYLGLPGIPSYHYSIFLDIVGWVNLSTIRKHVKSCLSNLSIDLFSKNITTHSLMGMVFSMWKMAAAPSDVIGFRRMSNFSILRLWIACASSNAPSDDKKLLVKIRVFSAGNESFEMASRNACNPVSPHRQCNKFIVWRYWCFSNECASNWSICESNLLLWRLWFECEMLCFVNF